LADEGVRIGHLRHFLDAAAVRAVVAAGDVLRDGAGKQQVALHDIADLGPVIILVDHAHVVAVDQDLALGGRIKAHQQFCQRRLARAAAADDGHQLAGLDVDADVLQHIGRVVAAVAEIQAFELDLALQVGQHHSRGDVAGFCSGSMSSTSPRRSIATVASAMRLHRPTRPISGPSTLPIRALKAISWPMVSSRASTRLAPAHRITIVVAEFRIWLARPTRC
jgi:hypothetical protein